MMARTFSDDDIQNVSDRLENAGAVIHFLSTTHAGLCYSDDSPVVMTDKGIFGCYLVYRWIEAEIDAVQRFILEQGTSL